MSRFDFRSIMGCCAVLIALFAGASGAATGDLCDAAALSDVNTTLRVRGDQGLGRQCFTTELPAAGWLLLEATVPSAAAVEPRLDFLGSSCDASQEGGRPFRYQTRSANTVLLAVSEAGSYHFCVAPQDPAHVLGDYRVVNGFAAFGKEHEEEHEPEPDPVVDPSGCVRGTRIAFAKEHEEEHEPEPDPLVDPYGCRCRSSSVAAASGKEHEEEHEPEPDPFTIDPCDRRLRRLCSENRTDDHADTLSCASLARLGRPVTAELGNGWQDDGDLFAFYVEEPATVRIESNGPSDTVGGLYDRHGYRLCFDDDSGSEANFRIVKTLAPGWYFAQVEGRGGASGVYELSVGALGTEE